MWIRPSGDNAKRILAALKAFGAPTDAVTARDFSSPGVTFQIGVAPVRIDIITAVDGLTFESSWQNRMESDYGGERVFVLSRQDFIRNKRASGRPQDLADIEALERRQ